VISMGGYNSTCELLSFKKRSLIVPRMAPRLEQWIRANRLETLGWVDVQRPDQVTSETITDWLSQPEALKTWRYPIDLNGLSRLPKMVLEVIQHSLPHSYRVS
jgi:predicted glycosyltransferase